MEMSKRDHRSNPVFIHNPRDHTPTVTVSPCLRVSARRSVAGPEDGTAEAVPLDTGHHLAEPGGALQTQPVRGPPPAGRYRPQTQL